LAIDAGIIDVAYDNESGNAIVDVAYSATDSVAGGFLDNDYAFVYTPAWFTSLGAGVVSSAAFSDGDFIVSGFWPAGLLSGAAGSPVVVHGSDGDSDTTLIGLDVTFRGHPENTFRILGNAIYNGLD
jgi:hypothetical protein